MREFRLIFFLLFVCLGVTGSKLGAENLEEKLSIEFKSTPIESILDMIAQQYGLNIVIGPAVTGKITVRLKDVDLFTALDAIILPNGFSYYLNDDVIVVKSVATETAGELRSRVLTLKYLDPITAQKALNSRKSKRGSIVILDKKSDVDQSSSNYSANRIMITDYPSIVTDLVQLVAQLDKVERMLSIEVKIIETKLGNKNKLGFIWPSLIETTLGSRLNAGTATTTTGTSTSSTVSTSVVGSMDIEAGNWLWGTLSVAELRTVLNLLEQNDRSKLLSDPRITTLENHEAEIKIQTIIPIATINRFSEAAATVDILTFQDEEVGISLTVTPRINENNRITLDVKAVVEDIIGFAGPPDNQKPITTKRSIKTTITVNNGESVALGGLLKENEIIIEHKVPLLGSIPLIGKILFTSKSTEMTTTDLMIIITPKILK